jgi:hypothetical protein
MVSGSSPDSPTIQDQQIQLNLERITSSHCNSDPTTNSRKFAALLKF